MKDNMDTVPEMGKHREELEYRAYRRSLIQPKPAQEATIPYMQKPLPPLEEVLPKVSPVYAELLNV